MSVTMQMEKIKRDYLPLCEAQLKEEEVKTKTSVEGLRNVARSTLKAYRAGDKKLVISLRAEGKLAREECAYRVTVLRCAFEILGYLRSHVRADKERIIQVVHTAEMVVDSIIKNEIFPDAELGGFPEHLLYKVAHKDKPPLEADFLLMLHHIYGLDLTNKEHRRIAVTRMMKVSIRNYVEGLFEGERIDADDAKFLKSMNIQFASFADALKIAGNPREN